MNRRLGRGQGHPVSHRPSAGRMDPDHAEEPYAVPCSREPLLLSMVERLRHEEH